MKDKIPKKKKISINLISSKTLKYEYMYRIKKKKIHIAFTSDIYDDIILCIKRFPVSETI